MQVLITTIPFGSYDREPLEILEQANIDYLINPFERKISEKELAGIISDFDALIAGTEPITDFVLTKAKKLKIIARVGVGYNNINLKTAKEKSIKITYTPNGPDAAVTDLTIGLMYSLLRATHVSNLKLHQGIWERSIGRRVSECSIGIIGVGKIGFDVALELEKIGTKSIMLNDINQNANLSRHPTMAWHSFDSIIKKADVITLHLPLTNKTENLITKTELQLMKKDCVLINTSRGGVVNENDLFEVMNSGHLFGAALDVFREEPYQGKLIKVDRCLLTAHTASMTIDCRTKMELAATKEVVDFFQGKELNTEIPNYFIG